jgi:acyl carrier protein
MSLAAKVHGAWNLHRLLDGRSLDWLVLFSSAAAILGSPGQGSYAAANAALDALALYRQARGLPGLSICWGPWSEVGLAARPDRGGRLAELGIGSLTPEQGVAVLGRLLGGNGRVTVLPLEPRLLAGSTLARNRLLADLLSDLDEGSGSLRELLAGAGSDHHRQALLVAHLCEQVGQVLRLPGQRIDTEVPLQSLGLDSLGGLELRNRLEASLGLGLPATIIWSYPTISTLGDHLATRLLQPADDQPAGVGEGVTQVASGPATGEDDALHQLLAEVGNLSEDDLRRLLEEDQ